MGTLVVLTDFTIRAESAAFYASDLAKQIRADLLLCHVLPKDTSMDDDVSPGRHSDHIDMMYDLAELSGRMRLNLQSVPTGHFMPTVSYGVKTGSMADALNEIGLGCEVIMAVISAHHSLNWLSLLIGSKTGQLIEHTRYPVLVIPYGIKFRPLKTIAFATDLKSDGLEALHVLSGLAGRTEAEIVITYVPRKKMIERGNSTRLQKFFDLVTREIIYSQKRYQIIHDKKVVSGLKRLPVKIDIDLIAMIHRKRDLVRQLFGASFSLSVLNFAVRPIIIFPSQISRSARK